jgi:molybdate transport system regulatory protein
MKDALHSNLVLSRGSTGRVGSDRIALVEAVAREGSITKAAKTLGLSYRGAWDAVQAVNNLFDEPLIAASTGGASGGAAQVTPRGLQVVAAYRRIETELADIWNRLDEAGLPAADIWSLGMKTSARNALRGVVEAITGDAVNAEVVLSMGGGVRITAVVTETSVKALGLKVGAPAVALIKSSFVILAPDGPPMRTSARNLLRGQIVSRTDGGVTSEVVLELAEGKTLAATLTLDSADALGLRTGDMAWALIKAPHVILAVE